MSPPVLLPPPKRAPREALTALLVRLGRLLLSYGCPTHRLEACLRLAAECHGYRAEVLGVPTGVWISLDDGRGAPQVRLVRVDGWTVDLGRLAARDAVVNRVSDGQLTVAQAEAALDAIEAEPLRYGPIAHLAAGALASASAAAFFGGGVTTVAIALLLGLCAMGLGMQMGRHARTRLLTDFAIGALAGAGAWLAATIDPTTLRRPLVLAGVIGAVPGLTLTSALAELAAKNLVSGTARLMEAGMTLLSLIFGLATVATLEAWVSGGPPARLLGPPVPPHLAVVGASTVVAALGFAVLFRVPPRELLATLLSGVLAWGSAFAAARYFVPGPTAAFAGAVTVGLYANALARRTQQPAQLYVVPGIVMLVPGAFGFVALENLWSGDVGAGASGFFATVLTASALALGLLLASAALPARKVL